MAASRLGRTFAALIGSQLIARIVRLGYVFAVARFITPDAMGVFQYALAFYLALGVFAELGQTARLGAEAPSTDDIARLLTGSRVVMMGATVATTAIGTLYLCVEVPPTIVGPALVTMISLMARTYAYWVRGAFIAIEDAGWIPRYELVFRGLEAIAGITALVLGGDVLTLCWVHSVGWYVEALFCHGRLVERFGRLRSKDSFVSTFARAARASFAFVVTSSMPALYWQICLVILTAAQGHTDSVGQLGIAMQLLAVAATAPMMLGTALVPAIGRVRKTGGNELSALRTILKLALVIGAAVAPIIAGTAVWLVEVAVGPGYREAGQILGAIGWALGPYAAAQLAMAALNGLGRHRAAAIVALSVVGVHLAAIPLLWSMGPVVAVQWSLVAGAGVGGAIGLWAVGQSLEPRGHAWWLGPAALLAGAGVFLHLVHVPGAFAIASAGVLVLAVALRMIRVDELRYIAKQLGHRG